MDAVRVKDGKRVVLRRVDPQEDASVSVLSYLNSPELLADPRNRTVPLLDVLYPPCDEVLIVMPLLHPFQSTECPFRYVSEVLEALDQFLQASDKITSLSRYLIGFVGFSLHARTSYRTQVR